MKLILSVALGSALLAGSAFADVRGGLQWDPSSRLHEQLDRCHYTDSICIGHVFIDTLFAVFRPVGPGPGPGPVPTPEPVNPMKVEFFTHAHSGSLDSCWNGTNVATITLYKGNPSENMRTCDLLERSLPAHASTPINCVRIDGKGRGSIAVLKLPEQCRAQAFL